MALADDFFGKKTESVSNNRVGTIESVLSGIASGTSMRWKIETLNQSDSKETRIQAVSLGWS